MLLFHHFILPLFAKFELLSNFLIDFISQIVISVQLFITINYSFQVLYSPVTIDSFWRSKLIFVKRVRH